MIPSTIDPAWFYSTLAQVAAAIVGLIGAILGSRLIEHLQMMRTKRSELDEQIRETQALGGMQTVDRWLQFREFLIQEIVADEDAIKNGHSTRISTQKIGWGFTKGTNEVEVEVATHKAEQESELVLVQQFLTAYPSFEGHIGNLSTPIAKLRACLKDLPVNHPAENHARNNLEWFERLGKSISQLREKLLPRSFFIVFVLLAWIAASCIVWPLAALPGFAAQNPSARFFPMGYMWIALVIGLLGLLCYFGYVLREIHNLGELVWFKREEFHKLGAGPGGVAPTVTRLGGL